MCRNIVSLRRPEGPATDEEIRAAALQFVRKVSGYRAPSRRNHASFEQAVDEVAAATHRLLEGIGAGTVATGGPAQASATAPAAGSR
jgi:hypothetical protein